MVKATHHSSLQSTARAEKRERIFELSLPAVVKGLDASGKRFEEQTSTCSLSAQEASFHLATPLLIGTKLNLYLEVPRTLILEKPLLLQVSGSVVYVRSKSGNGKDQLAIIRLEKSYRLLSSLVSHS